MSVMGIETMPPAIKLHVYIAEAPGDLKLRKAMLNAKYLRPSLSHTMRTHTTPWWFCVLFDKMGRVVITLLLKKLLKD